jgi:carboxylesterase
MQRGSPEPFLFEGGSRAVLCVHGFTGSPYEVRPLGEALHRAGFTTLGIRLPGHESPREMERATAEQWKRAVLEGVERLEKMPHVKGPIGIAGLSMGGVLSLITAASLGPRIKALAALATPVHLSPRLTKIIQSVQRARLDRVLRFVPKIGGSDIGDPNGRKENPTLNATPVRSTFQLLELLSEVEGALPSVKQPLFLAHGAKDRTVPYSNLDYIAQHAGSAQIEVLRFPRSHHVLTLDIDRETIASAVVNFFQEKMPA